MNPVNAKAVLQEGCAILKELGLTYWLSAGTALGAYRDGFNDDFVRRDTDIDIGVLDHNSIEKIIPAFEEAGFVRKRVYDTHGIWSQCLMEKNRIWFDIYFFNIVGEHAANLNEHGMMIKPKELIENMATIEIDGTEYPIPTPVEDYLAIRYGDDWRTPSERKVPWEQEATNLVSL